MNKTLKKLSIALFSHTPNMDGAGRSLVDLVRGLTAEGVKCLIVLPNDGPIHTALLKYGCTICFAPDTLRNVWWWASSEQVQPFSRRMIKKALIGIQKSILPELKFFAPDFIISQTIVSPWGAVCAELMGIKHIFCPREYGREEHGLYFIYPFKEAMRAMYETSDWLFICSKGVAEHLFEDSEHKTEPVYGSIQLDEQCSEQETLEQLKLPMAKTVAQIATIAPGKGQLDLVNAVIELSKNGLKLNCLFIGLPYNKSYKAQLDHVIARSGFSEQFRFLDLTANPYSLMNSVDIIVSCATYEGFGRTLIEGSLLEKPIVFADHGGPSEVFIKNKHALSYQPKDYLELSKAIENVICDTNATRIRVSSAKTHLLSNFNDKNYGGKIYRRLCQLSESPLCRKHSAPVLAFLSAPFSVRFKIIFKYLISKNTR